MNPIPPNFAASTLVLLIDDLTDGDLIRALQTGVHSLLPRTVNPAQVLAAIAAAAAGLIAFA